MRPYTDTLVGPEGYEADLSPYSDAPPTPQSALEVAMYFDRDSAVNRASVSPLAPVVETNRTNNAASTRIAIRAPG